jgi:hypothetical protein
MQFSASMPEGTSAWKCTLYGNNKKRHETFLGKSLLKAGT